VPDQKFIIKIGGESRDFTRTVGRVKRNLGGLKRAVFSLQGALGGIGAALSFRAIIQATERQQQAMRQLEQRIDSTGGAAGKTSQELAAFAAELQTMTTFGDEAIIEMQSLLLTFTQIAGPQFDRATAAVLDMSVAMGQDLKSSALSVGKALNDPIRGLNALSRSGVQFTDDQRALVKSLVDTGRTAEAQGVILEELQRQFGGAAEAATDTLGGALSQLGNAFGDLLEAKGGGMNDAVAATKELTAVMQDPATVAGMNAITTAVIDLAGWMAKAVAGIAAFTKGVAEMAAGASGFGAEYDALNKKLEPLQERLDELQNSPYRFLWNKDEVAAEAAAIEQEIETIKRAMGELQFDRPGAPGAAPKPAGTGVPAPGRAATSQPREAPAGPAGFGAALDQAVARQSEAAAKIQEQMQRSAEAVKDLIDPTRALNRELDRNRELYEAGYLSGEQYAQAQQDVQRRIGEARGGFEEINDAIQETGDTLNEFAVQGARNIESALADFFFEPFKDGLSGLGDSLLRTLNRMAADIAAAKLAEKLFGDVGGGGGGGGWVGAAVDVGKSVLAGIFHQGGIAGAGGPTRAVPAMAFAGAPRFAGGGEVPAILHQGEEVLTRNDPRHRRNGGGVSVTNNFTIQGEASRQSQEQIAARVGDSVRRAMQRNR